MARGPKRAPGGGLLVFCFVGLVWMLDVVVVSRTRSVADGCIKWCTDNGNVVVLIGLDKTPDRLQVGEAGNAGESPL